MQVDPLIQEIRDRIFRIADETFREIAREGELPEDIAAEARKYYSSLAVHVFGRQAKGSDIVTTLLLMTYALMWHAEEAEDRKTS